MKRMLTLAGMGILVASLCSSCALYFLLPEKPKALPLSKDDDTNLESKMLTAIREHAKSGGWEEDFKKIVVTSSEWTVVRNSATGIILGRYREGAACAKWPDGHCTFQYFDFWQDEQGGGYSNSVQYYAVGDQFTCNCDDIK
jgi:hypothetical protein